MTPTPGVDRERQPWETGTSEDQFTGIYLLMAEPRGNHRGFSPPEVDQMTMPTIAALLGIVQERQQRATLASSLMAVPFVNPVAAQ